MADQKDDPTPSKQGDSKLDQKRIDKATEILMQKANGGKLTKQDIFLLYAKAIDRESKWRFAAFSHNYKVILTIDKKRLVVECDQDNVCRYVSDEEIVCSVLKYWEEKIQIEELWLDFDQASRLVSYWKARAKTIERPAIVAWKSQDDFCFRRLPFDYVPGVNFPTLLFEICERMKTNSKAFCIFIGSLLDTKSDRQQYLWLFGDGQNSKSAISRFLYRVFGSAYAALNPPHASDRFWSVRLVSARVGVFPDCNHSTFVTSGFFKTLTGNDPIDIERKGKDPFSARIDTKFIFLSNTIPVLSSEKADLRRAIFCELDAIKGDPDPNYDKKLWDQAQDILSYCVDAYNQHVAANGHSAIPVEDDSFIDLVSEETDSFEGKLQRHFELTSIKEDFCVPHEFQALLEKIFPANQKKQGEFKRWLKRTYGVSKRTTRIGGLDTEKRYHGIKIKRVQNSLGQFEDGCWAV